MSPLGYLKGQPFHQYEDHDLTAGDAPARAEGEFIVYEHTVPDSQVDVVKAIVPWARERIDIGLPSERITYIDPLRGNQAFVFTPLIEDKPLYPMDSSFAHPKAAASVAQDADRQIFGGITSLSVDPYNDAARWLRAPFAYVLQPGSTFRVTFRILPVSAGGGGIGVGGQWAVGGAGGAQRVDFAGALVMGHRLPKQLFDKEKACG